MGVPEPDPQEQPPLGHIELASRARKGGHIAIGSNAYKLANAVQMDIFVDFEIEPLLTSFGAARRVDLMPKKSKYG